MSIVLTLLLLLTLRYPDRVCVGSSKEDPKAFPVPVFRAFPQTGISGQLIVIPDDGILTLYGYINKQWGEIDGVIIWRYQYPCSCKQ